MGAPRTFNASLIVLALLFSTVFQRDTGSTANSPPLVKGTETMTSAWDVPLNPLTDSSLGTSQLDELIRRGFRIFTNTKAEAPGLCGNALSCSNCHLNAGQREKALPLFGVAGVFPEYNKRAARSFTLEDRIIGCLLRSQNGSAIADVHENDSLSLTWLRSEEVLALSAYITWLSRGIPAGARLPWRGQNTISHEALLPVTRLDLKKGEAMFKEHCTNCHGEDGQGVQIGDKKAGPLWGPESWNDGAGAARVYTLAGMIRYMMPYLHPGSLTDEQAQHIAAYINSKPRPKFPRKKSDYLIEPIPPDAVYYSSSSDARSHGR